MLLTREEIYRLSDSFESKTPQEILTWAIAEFWPEIALSSSFQTQSMPLLHMAARIRPDIRVLFLDTRFHFWESNLCCYIHKVQPMQKALNGLRAWITGIRRDQTPERAAARILELQKDNLLKVNPLLNWTKADVERYITEHNLPKHPLLERGFRSVGCQPCTQPVTTGEDDRAGRWPGLGKTDCGLHNEMFQQCNLNEARKFFAINSLKALDLEGEK